MMEIHYIRNTQRSQSLIERQSKRVYLESWSGVRKGLEAKLADIQEQKAQLEDKKKGMREYCWKKWLINAENNG